MKEILVDVRVFRTDVDLIVSVFSLKAEHFATSVRRGSIHADRSSLSSAFAPTRQGDMPSYYYRSQTIHGHRYFLRWHDV